FDLVPSVDDLGLSRQQLIEDLVQGLRWIPAHWGTGAGLIRRRLLRPAAVQQVLTIGEAVPLHGVDGMDVTVVELQGVGEEEVDLPELLLLDVERGARKPADLTGVV